MGIAKSFVELLLDEAKRIPFKGSVLQLGCQDMYFGEEDLKECADKIEFKLSLLKKPVYVLNRWINKNV